MKFTGIAAVAGLVAFASASPAYAPSEAVSASATTTTTTHAASTTKVAATTTTTKAAVSTTTTKAAVSTTTTTKAAVSTTTVQPDWAEWNATETVAPDVWTTSVLTAITTFCPGPTQITHAGKVYSITTATTLTISDCPCTVSVPVWTRTSTSCSTTATPAVTVSGAVSSVKTSVVAPAGTTSPSVSGWPAGAPSNTTGVVAPFTGAADKMAVHAVAGLAGVAGLAAMLL